MLTSQINKILSQNHETKILFRVVFPAEVLPQKEELSESFSPIQ